MDAAPAAAPPSAGQAALLLFFLGSTLLWAYAELLARKRRCPAPPPASFKPAPLTADLPVALDGAGARLEPPPLPLARSGLARCLRLEEGALLECRPVLRACTELGAILAWFCLADRTRLLGRGVKSYSRDVFGFLCLALAAAAWGGGASAVKAPAPLSRPQTEEWKGWMQILFLLYHYFDAKELYNAIRVFIAAYVWMTGYGNGRLYLKTGDFTAGRVAQTLWRLNLLCALCCLALRNSYMLYYICPMHTAFTLAVYGALAVRPGMNGTRRGLAAKLVACVAAVALVWEVPGVFDALWRPFTFLVGYVDPRRAAAVAAGAAGGSLAAPPPARDPLHEWRFRSGLDRYIWIHGMLCAALHPTLEGALARVDAAPRARRWAARGAVAATALASLAAWHRTLFTLPKARYNALHPYTSWVPITAWIALRNLTPALRTSSSTTLSWLGAVTLETYVSQFHTWLVTDVPDGQPKALLALLPGGAWPLTNFVLTSALALTLSRRLFLLTATLRDVVVPHAPRATTTETRLLARNAGAAAALGGGLWVAGRAAIALAGVA